MEQPLVSVVIPCGNRADYLADALDSVTRQTYAHREVIVVEDGSTDGIDDLRRRCPVAKWLKQEGEGLSAARNCGFAAGRGRFVVFLDAGDRLLPRMLEIGVDALTHRSECAFWAGRARMCGAPGGPLTGPSLPSNGSAYAALLRMNFIRMPGSVVFRRSALQLAGTFKSSVDASAEYDLYLRLARRFPVCFHNEVVAEYLHQAADSCHDTDGVSRDLVLMLRTTLRAHASQRMVARRSPELWEAYKAGRRFWRLFYGERLVEQARQGWRTGAPVATLLRRLCAVAVYYPAGFANAAEGTLRRRAANFGLRFGT